MSDHPSLSSLFYDPSYNPGDSILYYTSIYGNGTDISFNEIQSIVNGKINESIMFGVRCGAASLTFVIMWMISRNKKTPIFIINQCSLLLMIIHSGLYFKYLLSNFSSITYTLTGFPQTINRNNVYVYGAANIFQVLLVASIEASLIFQIKVVFKGDVHKRLGNCLVAVSSLLGLITVTMYFVTAIKGMIAIYNNVNDTEQYYFNVSTILLASSINFLTFILVIKLVLAIRTRRYLGLKQFDSFHILLIMCTQTLITPSILFILAYSLNADKHVDKLIIIGTLLAVISLPLSSMWATSINNSSTPTSLNTDCSFRSSRSYRDDISKSFMSQPMEPTIETKFITRDPGFYPTPRDSNKSSANTYFESIDIENGSTNEPSKGYI